MNNDEIHINRCLTLARYAERQTSPSPLVGAVVVHSGKIIGEGYGRCGELHAEEKAIAAVSDKSLLRHSTLYVNLEPSDSQSIVKSGIPRVVVGMRDVDTKTNGKGIGLLRQAGIDVTEGVLAEECHWLNRRFITFVRRYRPYIILKWAQTADGFIDIVRESPELPPLKISNTITKTLNHQIRTHEAAIMVGTRTVFLDNPHLTVSKWTGKNPIRIFIDRNLRMPRNYRVFDGTAQTIVFNDIKDETHLNIVFVKLDFGQNIIPQMLDFLYRQGVVSVIVEGGRQLLQSFIDMGVWDEAIVEESQQRVGTGVNAPVLTNNIALKEEYLLKNRCTTYTNSVI